MAAGLHLMLFKHRRELGILGCEYDGIKHQENVLLHGVNVLHVLDELCAKLILLIHLPFLLDSRSLAMLHRDRSWHQPNSIVTLSQDYRAQVAVRPRAPEGF